MRSAPHHAAGLASLTVNKPDPKVLQDFLALKFALSRRTAKAMIDGRSVWVNRKCIWIARFALKTGDLVEVPSAVVKGAQRQSSASVGSSVKSNIRTFEQSNNSSRHIRVLWQNDAYLVCDKPAGVVSCDDSKSAETILRVQEDFSGGIDSNENYRTVKERQKTVWYNEQIITLTAIQAQFLFHVLCPERPCVPTRKRLP